MSDQVMDGDEGDYDTERTVLKLIHAYAITVDKSQGSEWDFVIVFIPEFNSGNFLCVNRIYTAITRTKRACWCIVSDTEAFNTVSVRPASYRCDNLAQRLKARLPNLKPFTATVQNDALYMADDIPDGEMPPEVYDMGVDSDDF
jgi:hypothetical protein